MFFLAVVVDFVLAWIKISSVAGIVHCFWIFTHLLIFPNFKMLFVCDHQVFLSGGVELWLSEISRVLQETVHEAVVNCVEDAKTLNYIDEIAQKVWHNKLS